MMKMFRSRFYLALFLMGLVLTFGVLGYRYIAEFTWVEALYMTVITVSTVGFKEVRPLSTEEQLFTVILITASIFIFAFAISVVTEYILSRNSLQVLKKKKVKQQIDQLENHVIVCGFGRNGAQAVARLMAYRKPFVVIEKDREVIEKHEASILFVEGDANEPSPGCGRTRRSSAWIPKRLLPEAARRAVMWRPAQACSRVALRVPHHRRWCCSTR